MLESTSGALKKLLSDSGESFLRSGLGHTANIGEIFADLLTERQVSSADWIRSVGISKTYGYQILRGERRPGRDVVLRTALCLRLDLAGTQRLLALSGCGALYPKLRRDAALIFALDRGMRLLEAEELLSSLPERGLYPGDE